MSLLHVPYHDALQVPWGGVTLLPFVDEAVLESVVFPLLEKLPPEVLKRNETGKVVLLMREENEQSWRQHGLLLSDKDSGNCEHGQLASLDPVYERECFFFKTKIIHRSLGVVLDIPRLLSRINSSIQENVPRGGEQREIRIFPSTLPWAFPDVVDSCVVEEEVLVLPPLLAARLELAKIVGVLRIVRPTIPIPSPSSQVNIKDAVEAYVTKLRWALQCTDLSSVRQLRDPPVSLPPLPNLSPRGNELLFPTAPLPGASPAAAVLTPSLHSKCIAVSKTALANKFRDHMYHRGFWVICSACPCLAEIFIPPTVCVRRAPVYSTLQLQQHIILLPA